MNKKVSAYQKLKQKNESLMNDLYKIVKKDCIETKLKYRMIFDFEEMIWQGSPTK